MKAQKTLYRDNNVCVVEVCISLVFYFALWFSEWVHRDQTELHQSLLSKQEFFKAN